MSYDRMIMMGMRRWPWNDVMSMRWNEMSDVVVVAFGICASFMSVVR